MLGLFAHGVHLLLVLLGLVGVAARLLPQAQAARSRRRTFRVPTDPSEHEQRVAMLREAVQNGQLTTAPALGGTTWGGARRSAACRSAAATSSIAAAGVHAAVFPHHLDEALLVGLFFLAMT